MSVYGVDLLIRSLTIHFLCKMAATIWHTWNQALHVIT